MHLATVARRSACGLNDLDRSCGAAKYCVAPKLRPGAHIGPDGKADTAIEGRFRAPQVDAAGRHGRDACDGRVGAALAGEIIRATV
ncbi:hypothetical protein ACU4GR_00660 [Methylobacterium oryzae CBMB20]